MKRVRVVNVARSTLLGSSIGVADSSWTRLRGMLGRPAPSEGEGLLLAPCRGVHMYGMRYPLDVVFLDEDGVVVASFPALAPGQRTPLVSRAAFALELPAGTVAATGTAVGDPLYWTPVNGRVAAR